MIYELKDINLEKKYHFDIIPEGNQVFIVTGIEERESSNGGKFLIVSLDHPSSSGSIDVWCNLEVGKRWLIKSLLESIGSFKKTGENSYIFEDTDLIGMKVVGVVENITKPEINMDGNEITRTRSRVKTFKALIGK